MKNKLEYLGVYSFEGDNRFNITNRNIKKKESQVLTLWTLENLPWYWCTDNIQEFSADGGSWVYSEWKQRQPPAAEVRKILFVEKRRERLHGGMQLDPETSGPIGQVGNWVFIAFFYCPRVEMSLRYKQVSWEGEVSPWPIITFGTSCSLFFNSNSMGLSFFPSNFKKVLWLTCLSPG
jgi:hypothetical protein